VTRGGDHDRRPFLSLIALPAGWGRDDLIERLHRATGVNQADLRVRLAADPPLVVGRVEAAAAAAAVAAIRGAGGDAFAPTLEDLARLGPALRIKVMTVEGGVHVELWEGVRATIARQRIQILVRGQITREVVDRRGPPRFSSVARRVRTRDSIRAEIEASTTRRIEASHKLDIHTSDGTIFQVDGDAFDFKILGQRRGFSDSVNVDLMLELLRHLAPPEVIVDEYFRLWHPPPGHQRLRLPGQARLREDPAFAFYSRWVALMYRHLTAA
jgi:hypothetical protein